MISEDRARTIYQLSRWYIGAIFSLALVVIVICFQAQPYDGKILEPKSGSQWYPYLEWELENSTFEGNPFNLKAKVEFTHPHSGESIKTEMFYDGEDHWKFRFSGIDTGVWTFHTISTDQDLDGWEGKATITVNTDKNAHGFIKSFPPKWGWQGIEEAFVPQFVMGKDLDYYFDMDRNEPDLNKMDTDIEEFVQGHGFTGFTIKISEMWFDLEKNGRTDNPDIRTYETLEALLTKVHAMGGACHLWMWGSDGKRNKNNGDGPRAILGHPGNDIDQRNMRYIAARLGPIPGWTMGYGIDTENGVATVKQLDFWKGYLEQHLGWDHFLGARVGYDEKGLWALDPSPPRPPHDEHYRSEISDEHTFWLGGDYIGYTSYRPMYDRYVEAINHHPEKPSFEEDRFRLRESKQWSYKDYNEEMTRRGLWHSALAGGVANIWGNLLPVSDHGGSHPYAIKDQIKTYACFFENRFLINMESEKSGNNFCLKTPDFQHIIYYREKTDAVVMKLNNVPAEMPAVAVDTRKAYKEIPLGNLSSGEEDDEVVWKAPYISDWAIAVGKFE